MKLDDIPEPAKITLAIISVAAVVYAFKVKPKDIIDFLASFTLPDEEPPKKRRRQRA